MESWEGRCATSRVFILIPNGIGKEASEWIERVESHLKLGFKNIMLDFCFSHVPIDEAKGFLEGFAREVFPSFH